MIQEFMRKQAAKIILNRLLKKMIQARLKNNLNKLRLTILKLTHLIS